MARWRSSLLGRLLLAHLFVILVGVLTLLVAALSFTPPLFNQHLTAIPLDLAPLEPLLTAHLLQAFRDAIFQSLVVAALMAAATALLASLFAARQIARPIQQLVAATQRIAAGRYSERVTVTRVNQVDEVGQLATSLNVMAQSLEQTERRRLELLGDVAHELRTPLAIIEGSLEGLLDGVVPASPETWARLHDEAGRLRRLVDDLQALSRAEAKQLALELRPTVPADIVQTALDRLAPALADRGLTLLTNVPDNLPPVLADRDRAVQVLTNLLTNALRYTPPPGQLTITAARHDDSILFQVSDTGIGFAPDQADRLFERFYRVDPSRSRALGGSGIGLTIARALVDAQGGHIWATSPGPGQGSTFSFTLPLAR